MTNTLNVMSDEECDTLQQNGKRLFIKSFEPFQQFVQNIWYIKVDHVNLINPSLFTTTDELQLTFISKSSFKNLQQI